MSRLSTVLILTLAAAAASAAVVAPRQSSVDCRDDLPADTLANVPDAVSCINQLAARGDQPCNADSLSVTLCNQGGTAITVLNKALNEGGGNSGSGAVTCQGVAQAAGRIMDFCSRGDGKVRGATDAFTNANVLVDIRLVD